MASGSFTGDSGLTDARNSTPEPQMDPLHSQMQRELEFLIQENVEQVLQYHLTHRPINTAKNYYPKQKEWQVYNIFPFYIVEYPG
jgi:hypothetical protein